MISKHQGFRPNVGIILINEQQQVFWAKRMGQNAWQCPQGGIDPNEDLEKAMFRELNEEIGLTPEDVSILGHTKRWLHYRLPDRLVRRHQKPIYIGQKQKWFLLELQCDSRKIQLDATPQPEFDSWRWVDYHYPSQHVVDFKQKVYQQAFDALHAYLPTAS